MKGLLLKDFYLTIRHFRVVLPVAILFVIVSVFSDNASFFAVYPCLLAGIIPLSLYSYDEHDKWCGYSQTLPVTKTQYVLAKYIFGLIFVSVVGIPLSIIHTLRMADTYQLMFSNWIGMISELLITGLLPMTIMLPFMFKFGAEKGRVAFIVIVLLFVVAAYFTTEGTGGHWIDQESIEDIGGAFVPLIVIGLFILSGVLSCVFYRKREF